VTLSLDKSTCSAILACTPLPHNESFRWPDPDRNLLARQLFGDALTIIALSHDALPGETALVLPGERVTVAAVPGPNDTLAVVVWLDLVDWPVAVLCGQPDGEVRATCFVPGAWIAAVQYRALGAASAL
jgi:hypothetical protein